MRIVRSSIVICLLIALSAQASAETGIPGWGDAKWGLSHSEVKKKYDLNTWEPDDTPVCKSKKKVRILGRDFAMAFYFDERSDSGKLFKVVLVHFSGDQGDTTWLNSIKDMLVEKYGNPESFEIKEKMKISRWQRSDGQLKLTTLAGRTVMCALEYMAVGMEAEKL